MRRQQRPSVLVVLCAAALLVAGAAAGDPGTDKARIDGRLADLRGSVDQAGRREGVLTTELSAVSGRVREIETGVEAQQARLAVLQGQLGGARDRLGVLDGTIATQTRRLTRLRADYAVALGRLERRVRLVYETDSPDLLSFVLGTSSFGELLDNLDALGRIGGQDRRMVSTVEDARDEMADARRRTRAARVEAASLEQALEAATGEQQGLVARLAATRDALVAAERDKSLTLASIRESREDVLAEIEGLEAQSASLGARIRAAQEQAASSRSASPPTTGTGRLSWPVSGPVTSGFGVRWGRLHEGIDIGVPSGTPVGSAAPGTVIFAGWLGGYGNLVVVDHGNGRSTAYAHNSSFAVSVGQTVVTGEVLAYSGSTGHSTGPHVHFEVRVDGSAVDPLGYL